MPDTDEDKAKFAKQAAEKLMAVLNRADEIGGEIRDFLQEKMATDPRYVQARKAFAKLMGREFESRGEAVAKATQAEQKRAATAAPTPAAKNANTDALGNPGVKAQIYGKKSCPWSGR